MATAQSVATEPLARLPLEQNGGTWPSGHVQGIAVDVQGGYIYYSFTNLLAKYDFSGKLVGTLVGWTGHLGDLDFNPADGKVYGSLEYGKDQAFYIAMIDVSRLDRVGIEASKTKIFRTVYLPEVTKDFAADLDGDGKFDGVADHRYGCSGIDGVGFGPAFGHADGPRYLTVAYGIYGNTERNDNDHQVLLQYDVSDWSKYAQAAERSGSAPQRSEYIARQVLRPHRQHDLGRAKPFLRRLAAALVHGRLPGQEKILSQLPAVRDRCAHATEDERPCRRAQCDEGWERGQLLELADDGLKDAATGVRGWNQKADVGFQPVGQGLFYLSVNSGSKGAQTSDLTLMRWTGDANQPFVPVKARKTP